jgi:hypothetical protein
MRTSNPACRIVLLLNTHEINKGHIRREFTQTCFVLFTEMANSSSRTGTLTSYYLRRLVKCSLGFDSDYSFRRDFTELVVSMSILFMF